MKSICRILLLICLYQTGAVSFGEESFSLLLVTRSNSPDTAEFESLSTQIYSDLLLSQGIVAVPFTPPEEMQVSSEAYLTEARQQAMVFMAVNTLSISGDTIVIDAEFFYTADGSMIFETSASGSVALGLERKLEFIAAQASGLVGLEIADRGREEVLEAQRLMEKEADYTETVEQEQMEEEQNETPAAILPLLVEVTDRRTWAFESSVAAVFPLGSSADYLSTGVGLNLGFSYDFEVDRLLLSPGLRTGVSCFQTDGAIRSADNLLIDLALQFTVRFTNPGIWHPFVGVSGGAGILGITDGIDPWLWKVVPSVGFQAGVDIILTDGVALLLACESKLYFETSLLIVTLEPGFGGRFSW